MHVPLSDPAQPDHVLLAQMERELQHLQYFAYAAAATRACDTLPRPASRLIVDRSKSVIRWFNERKQAGRLLESDKFMDATLPAWPAVTQADDADHNGLQVADVLTYYATKQFFRREFAEAFDPIRHKSQFMVHVFDPQVCRPYNPPPGVTVGPLPKKP